MAVKKKKTKRKSVRKSPSRRTAKLGTATASRAALNYGLPPNVDLSDVWPSEREFMARPERYKYVRKLVKPTGCVFCQARDKGPSLESLCLYKDKHSMVILNKYPYNSGHVLILPVRHVGNLSELTSEEYQSLSQLLLKTTKSVEDTYECAGMNIGMNHGPPAGAGIPDHLHWHVVPRWFGDTNFFPLIGGTKLIPETLEQTYNRLLPYFAEKK